MTAELLWELALEATGEAYKASGLSDDEDVRQTTVHALNAVKDALDAVRTEQYKNETAPSIWERGEECAG